MNEAEFKQIPDIVWELAAKAATQCLDATGIHGIRFESQSLKEVAKQITNNK